MAKKVSEVNLKAYVNLYKTLDTEGEREIETSSVKKEEQGLE